METPSVVEQLSKDVDNRMFREIHSYRHGRTISNIWEKETPEKRVLSKNATVAILAEFIPELITCQACKGQMIFPARRFHLLRVTLKAISSQSTSLLLAVLGQTIILSFTGPKEGMFIVLLVSWTSVFILLVLNAQINVYESYKEERSKTIKDRESGYVAWMESQKAEFSVYEHSVYITPFHGACFEFALGSPYFFKRRFIQTITLGLALIPHWVWSLGNIEHEHTHSACFEYWKVGAGRLFKRTGYS